MAALAMTPKLLGHISNEKYQEKNKWKIDDIALGPANELLISGHNLEISETFISMYKEYSGKYGNRPEFNRNFRQPQPGEQLAMFLEGSSIIGLKVESALQLVTVKDMGVFKTLKWKRFPICVCFYRGKLYAASSSSNIVSVCNLDSEEKSDIFLGDMRSDCVLEIVVVMEKIYACTKDSGRALVFSMTGSKKMEFKNTLQPDAIAKSICIHERTELVFVSWNNFQIQIFSQKTSRCLRAFDMSEELRKIRVTTENILVTLSASKCIVTVYDVREIIKFGEFQKTILSSVKKKHRKKLMSLDEENLESHSANSETNKTISFPWKSAYKQRKVEKLRDTKELYMKQIEEVENLQSKSDTDSQKLHERIKELEDMNTELENQQKTLNDNLDEEKGKLNDRIKDLEGMKTELENQQKTLKDNLDEEKGKLNEKIKELEDTRTELKCQQKKLKDDLDEEKRKVSLEGRSSSQDVINLKKVEERNKKLEKDVANLKDKLSQEERIAKEAQTSSLESENARKILEQTKSVLEKEKENLTKLLAAEKRNETELEKSLAKVVSNLNKVEERNTTLEDEMTLLQERSLAVFKIAKEVKTFFLTVHASQMELKDKNLKLQEENEHLNILLSQGKRALSPQGMLSRFLSDAEKRNRNSRSNTPNNDTDELGSVIAESVDTGIYSSNSTSTRHVVNPLLANGELLNPDLKVAVTLTLNGAHMHIPETGVELVIPKGAVQRKRLIEMTIIPFDKQCAPIENFSRNSSVVVELLPNKAIFDMPVRLKLPHCLQLKNDYKDSKNPVRVFVSHHEAGPPVWEEDSSAKCTLEVDHCIILLKQFCWVKYEINDKLVVAKRLKVFTAGKSLHPNDSIAEIEVGYYMDLPGRAENMTASLGMEFCQNKPFVFVKEGELSLQLVLIKIVPKEWTYISPDDNPKTISYKSVADDKDASCPFALEKSSSSERKPYCIFKIVQGNESVELSMRF